MELSEVLRRRHMTRNFSDEALEPDVVDRLMESALRAPSAGNSQGREFVVLEGPAQTSLYWSATTDEAWRNRSRRFAGLSRAPVVVLPFADPDAYVARYREQDKAREDGTDVEWVVPFWFVDVAFASLTLMLSAADAGIGVGFLGNFRGESELRSVLGVPERFRWLGAVLLGRALQPDPPSQSSSRSPRSLEECVHRGGW